MIAKSVVTALVMCCFPVCMYAQSIISGKVIDADTNEPVAEANIRVDNSLAGCTTNAKGDFAIANLPQGQHKLSITHISYLPVSYVAKDHEKNILIKLHVSYSNVGQVVVTGTGTHHRMTDSPVPVSVITAKDLSNSGVTSLEDALLKLTPSFSKIENGMGSSLSLNGLPENYFLLLLNGRRMASDDTYSRIDPHNVKRIEILNGASSALYGTNAIGGVVNIITEDPKNAIDISSNTRQSSHGRFIQSVNADLSNGKLGSYTSYRFEEAGNWQLSPFVETKGVLKPTKQIASTGFRSHNISQKFTYDATDRLSFYARAEYYNNKTRRPHDVYNYNMLHETYSLGAGSKYMINKSAYLTADYFSDYYISTYCFFNDDKRNNALAGDEQVRKRTRYHNATVKGIFNIGSMNKVSVGTEYLLDVLKSETDNIDKEKAYTLGVFAQDELTITKSLQALLGVRYIYHQYFKNYATPNVALMYKLKKMNFRAAYASGFRTPTLSEIYATDIAKTVDRMTIGNKNLKPEKSNYYSFNAEYNHSRFSVAANLFYNRLRDMIDYHTIATGKEAMAKYGHKEVRQRDNVSKAYVKGVTLSANGYLGAGFTLTAGYTHLNTEDESTGKPIDKSLKNTANVGAKWQHTWSLYSLNVDLNGRINSERYSKTYGYAPAFSLWDLNTRHSFAFRSCYLEPGFGIENLFNYTDDRPYNSNYATLNPGRAFYVSFSIRFKG